MNQELANIPELMCERASHYDIIGFVNGQQDCKNGVPHRPGIGESYDAGYSAQYELEQIQSTGAN